MSLITSCPACGTMFRVVPDQLKISEGWVRCGHCAEVFDATAHLVDEGAAAREAEAGQGARSVEPPSRPADLEARAAPSRQDVPSAAMLSRPAATEPAPAASPSRPAPMDSRPVELSRPASVAQTPADTERPGGDDLDPGENSSYFGSDSQALEPSPLDSPFVFHRSDLVPPGDASVFPPPPTDSKLPQEEVPDEDLQDLSFVRHARRKAFWRRPVVRLGLAFASLLLATALLVQLAYQDRDRLAQAQPELRPLLQHLCDALDCRLGPPRQIEAIVIESSGFQRVRNDTYRLAFTLRNAGRFDVAAPAIELTVTDSQDQPIARRVLLPAELGAGGKVVAAAGDWSVGVGVALSVPDAPRVAGYRLLAFYP